MKPTLIAGLLAIAFVGSAIGQDAPFCASVDFDKEKAEAQGLHWLGVRRMPFSQDQAVFYESGGRVVFSPVQDGCVSQKVYPLYAGYVEEKDA